MSCMQGIILFLMNETCMHHKSCDKMNLNILLIYKQGLFVKEYPQDILHCITQHLLQGKSLLFPNIEQINFIRQNWRDPYCWGQVQSGTLLSRKHTIKIIGRLICDISQCLKLWNERMSQNLHQFCRNKFFKQILFPVYLCQLQRHIFKMKFFIDCYCKYVNGSHVWNV